ncbi:hypothetical protein DFJ74DRAFT_697180 [Hyaloraphidium curvatum]|nr:hypothetical protein DFJ74DRAFT_697180 [Hyaloraphidium curvatum]
MNRPLAPAIALLLLFLLLVPPDARAQTKTVTRTVARTTVSRTVTRFATRTSVKTVRRTVTLKTKTLTRNVTETLAAADAPLRATQFAPANLEAAAPTQTVTLFITVTAPCPGAPSTTTGAKSTTKAAPSSTKSAPPTTTKAPQPSTAARSATSYVPPTTTRAPQSSTTAKAPQSSTTTKPPQSSTTVKALQSSTTGKPPQSSTTAILPKSSTTKPPPTTTKLVQSSTTKAPPTTTKAAQSSTTRAPQTTTKAPQSSTTTKVLQSSTTAKPPQSSTTTIDPKSSTTTISPRSSTTAKAAQSSTTAKAPQSSTATRASSSTTRAPVPTSTTLSGPPCNPSCASDKVCVSGTCIMRGTLSFDLVWESSTASLDILVKGPSGAGCQTISWGNTQSCGGELEADVDAANVPENIYWAASPPVGIYSVCVSRWAGPSQVSYRVVARRDGVAFQSISGTTNPAYDGSSCGPDSPGLAMSVEVLPAGQTATTTRSRTRSTSTTKVETSSRSFTRSTTSTALVSPTGLSQADAKSLWTAEYLPSKDANSLIAWTGSYATCSKGNTAAAFKAHVLKRINYYRRAAGMDSLLGLNDTLNAIAQAGALITARNAQGNHFPPNTWACWTQEGADAAGSSNIAPGSWGPNAIDGYMEDNGGGNYFAGHRRWILFPPMLRCGTGDVPRVGDSWEENIGGNNLLVLGGEGNRASTRPAVRDGFVAWPHPGYVPYQLVWERWSFSLLDANYSAAVLSVTKSGAAVAITKNTENQGYGDNTLVWQVPGAAGAKPASPVRYDVSLSGVAIETKTWNWDTMSFDVAREWKSYSYSVFVFDPDA